MAEEKTGKSLPLTVQILIGLLAGMVVAVIFINSGNSWILVDYVKPIGKIFIRILTFIAVPLVLFSMIKGITSLSGATRLGRLAGKTIALYLITTVIAISVGLVLVNIVKPGNFIDEDQRIANRVRYENWVASNEGKKVEDNWSIFTDERYQKEAILIQAKLKEGYDPTKDSDLEKFQKLAQTAEEQKQRGPLGFLEDFVPENAFQALGNNKFMLQVIFIAIFFGIAALQVAPEKSAAALNFIDSANEIFLSMINIIMKGAPFFVFALMAGSLGEAAASSSDSDVIGELLKGILAYGLTVMAGLLVMAYIVYPVLISMFAKIGLKKFFKSMGKAQSVAFSTSSSAATLPVTIETVENKLGASKEISNFVLPIGATVNMDGTSLYQAVAVVFLAQMHMVELDLTHQLMIMVTAVIASVGSAAVPSAGLVMLIIVLESVGLNPAWIMVIYPIDRLLDMCRTVVNVTGDAAVTTMVARSEGQLKSETKS